MATHECLMHLSEAVTGTDDGDELITAITKGGATADNVLTWIKAIRDFQFRDLVARQTAVEAIQAIEGVAGSTSPETPVVRSIQALIAALAGEAAAVLKGMQTDNEKRYALLYLFYRLNVRHEKLAYPCGELRRILDISNDTMDRWMKWLTDQGYIEHVMGGRGGREGRLYKITTHGRDLVERDTQSAPMPISRPTTAAVAPFIDESHIARLRGTQGKHDMTRVIRYCEELNSSYVNMNFMAVILLMRALLNHIPPIFGHSNFKSFISQSEKSVKDILSPLEDEARKVADYYSHSPVKHAASLPTVAVIDPYRSKFEFLIQEIYSMACRPSDTDTH